MSRPVQLHLQPPFYPKVCIRCGCGTGQREYFIDLGLNLSGYFNPMNEGDIYYCNECVKNLLVDISRLIAKREEETAPWAGDARADITYSWESQIDLSSIEAEIERTRITKPSNTNAESDDSRVEQVTGAVATATSVSESTVSPVFPDDEPNGGVELSFDET